MKILLVDSDANWINTITESLTQLGDCDVSAATDIPTALELIKQNSYRLVLADTRIHNGTGFELAQEIRKEHISNPEIVLMSEDPKVSIFECHQAGACQVLSKPINMPILTSLIRRLMKDERQSIRVDIDPTTMGALQGHISFSADPSTKTCKIDVSNLGRGGFFFKLDIDKKVPDVGTLIDFELRLVMVPNCIIKGRGIVRWNKVSLESTGAGVEFLQISGDSARLINAFVDLFKIRPFVPDERS